LTEKKEMDRRTYIKYLGAVVAGAAVVGVGWAGYEATKSPVVSPAVTTTETVTVSGTASPPPVTTVAAKNYSGITLKLVTQTGPFIAGPVYDHRGAWAQETGGTIEVIEVPWSDLYAKIMTSMTTGAKAFDILIHGGQFIPDYGGGGFTVDLTDRVTSTDPNVNPWWSDIMPANRSYESGWGGKFYAIPLDGDHHMSYYNKLAMENPDYRSKFKAKYGYDIPAPASTKDGKTEPLFRQYTWEEWRDMAEFFNKWDWFGDGKTHYGVMECMSRGTQSYWWIYDHAAPYSVLPGGPDKYHWQLYFDPETMEPICAGNQGWIEALKLAQSMVPLGPPGMLGYSVSEVRAGMVAGESALAIDWPDIGVMSVDPKLSKIVGNCGFGSIPGSAKVWDREKKDWVKADWSTDLDHSGAPINQWPINNGTGWAGHIVKTAASVDAAYDFLRFLGSPAISLLDVVRGSTGFNPYRFSHFAPESMRTWLQQGFTQNDALAYLDEIKRAFGKTDPVNPKKVACIPDLKLPGTAAYNDSLDLHYTSCLAGKETPEDCVAAIGKEWDVITDRFGRDKQKAAYQTMLSAGLIG
jgi:multiple sugar transport system substrate-binding protein